MKKLTIITIIALAFVFGNCKTLQYGSIKKVGDRTYAVETAEVTDAFFFQTRTMYLAHCTADAAGNFKCIKGKDGAYSPNNGYGAVLEK